MITDNELKFLQFVNNSDNAYVRKFNLIVKQKVLTQLSRNMLTELFINYRDNIDNKFNVNAVCMQCANSLFNIVLAISKKYFELQAKWELQLEEELQTIYAQEDAEEEERLNDETKVELNDEDIQIIKNHILSNIDNEKIGKTYETIYDKNTSKITSTLVVTEEKKEDFIKPVVHKKTDNTVPLLNKNKKKISKR